MCVVIVYVFRQHHLSHCPIDKQIDMGQIYLLWCKAEFFFCDLMTIEVRAVGLHVLWRIRNQKFWALDSYCAYVS